MRRLLVVALTALVFGACGGSEAPDGDGDSAPGPSVPAVEANGVWVLRSGSAPSGEIEIPPGTRITMEVDGSEIRGNAGCNSFGGGISIEGDAFDAGSLALTEIGCPPEVAEPEERFVEALEAADKISRDGKELTLGGTDTELVFRLVPPVDPKPLTGTEWTLDALVDGETVSSTIASAQPARLLLNDDGSFEGTTGCRSFTGEWEVSGDVVEIIQMVFRGDCKAAAAAQDSHVASVIGAGFRAERDEDRLTLTAERADIGLVYRSR